MGARPRKLTARQIAYLHTLMHKNRIPDAEYRELLHAAAGVESSKALDQSGLDRVLSLLEQLGFDVGDRRRPRPAVAAEIRRGMATTRQLGYIEDLVNQIFGADQPRFRHWLEHYFKVTHTRFLQAHDARRVIDALKAMQGRGYMIGDDR